MAISSLLYKIEHTVYIITVMDLRPCVFGQNDNIYDWTCILFVTNRLHMHTHTVDVDVMFCGDNEKHAFLITT